MTYKNEILGTPTASDIKVTKTLYQGAENEEKAVRTFNYNSLGTAVKTTTNFTRNSQHDALAFMTYKNEILGTPTASDIKVTKTLYQGAENEEKAVRTFNYNSLGTAVKTTTNFTRNSQHDALAFMTYKNEILGTPQASDIKVTKTLYQGAENEEKAVRTFNYNSLGTAVKTTTIFTRSAQDILTESLTYKGEVLGAPQASDIKVSRTLYEGPENEEKATRTFNYNSLGTAVKTTTIFTRNAQDVLTESMTYKGEVTGVPQASDIKVTKTLYQGAENEEKAVRTFNYNSLGTAVKTTTIFTRSAQDILTESLTYKGEVLGAPQASDIKVSRTLYEGPENEEKATRTFNYNSLGTAVKTTTIFTRNAQDVLTESMTYKGEVTGVPQASDIKVTKTLYQGAEN